MKLLLDAILFALLMTMLVVNYSIGLYLVFNGALLPYFCAAFLLAIPHAALGNWILRRENRLNCGGEV